MKLIINIPEEAYNDIQSRDWKNGELIFSEEWKAIHDGTPIPDNATNGDVFDAIFPKGADSVFGIDWWTAPYQKGGKE